MQAEIKAKIDQELAFAKARWGETRELKLLESSRGDVLDDRELLRMLRYFWLHGTVYGYVIARTRSTVQRKSPPRVIRPTIGVGLQAPNRTSGWHPEARGEASHGGAWQH